MTISPFHEMERMERKFGSFSRNVYLPTEVKSEEASATFKDGILEIVIPKSEEAKESTKKNIYPLS